MITISTDTFAAKVMKSENSNWFIGLAVFAAIATVVYGLWTAFAQLFSENEMGGSFWLAIIVLVIGVIYFAIQRFRK